MPFFFAPPRLLPPLLDLLLDVLRVADLVPLVPPLFFAELLRALVALPPLVLRAAELFFALPLFRLLVLPPDFLLLVLLVAIHFIRARRVNGPVAQSYAAISGLIPARFPRLNRAS
ncbi:MAG: hypothetical protein AVDCRST_MAG42-2187 [uncultured Chthoniobacterales bacterium]|uniref:Uncharacterized protein n=1 Tax=uncultured Chthoniobacterales bacterium TaxID=1836801 RepID=A0A6J4IEI8_9BACT|nr:MAG: hypothetical protein AVDCRST_MAG42-2187 [uncultured Chthoniobacterales bacterium]